SGSASRGSYSAMWLASRSTNGIPDFVCNRATALRVGVRIRSVTGHRIQKLINGGQDTLIIWQNLICQHDPSWPSLLVLQVFEKAPCNRVSNSTACRALIELKFVGDFQLREFVQAAFVNPSHSLYRFPHYIWN